MIVVGGSASKLVFGNGRNFDHLDFPNSKSYKLGKDLYRNKE